MTTDLTRLTMAKAEVQRARRDLAATMSILQKRMTPAYLVKEAWDGVREKGEELAGEAVQAAKDRPAILSAVVAFIALFLGRGWLREIAAKLLKDRDSGNGGDDDLVSTRIGSHDENYDIAAPVVTRPVTEGASA